MSRRREAAELAIALSLSTQEVKKLGENSSPSYKFSLSSGNTTQDSKDMELRPYLPPDGSGSSSGVHTGIGYGYGLPPSLGTVRPEDIMKAPSGRTESVQGSSNASSGEKNTSSAYNTSINSFPSPSTHAPQAIIPATNSGNHHPSSSSGNSSNPPIPTSFPHRRQPNSSNPNPIASPAWSSPIPPNLPSHVSSTELSSNRPLFSSTQGSVMPAAPITPDPRPTVLKTYGKATKLTPSPQKLQRTNPIILSSSPPSEPPMNSPTRHISQSPTKKRKNIVISDEEEEEEEEPIEYRTPVSVIPTTKTPKSRIEVVLPRSKPSSTTKDRRNDSPSAQSASNEGQESRRHHSPDPLDSLKGSGNTPLRNSTKTSQSTNQPPSSSAVTNASTSNGIPDSSSSRRISSRVADHKAKEAIEKEERRRRRREEKERKKWEEDLDKLTAKPQSSVSNTKNKDKEEEDVRKPITLKIQRPPISEKGSISEPIEIEDSLVNTPNPVVEPQPKKSVESKGKKRKSDIASIGDDDGSDGDFDPRAEDDSGKGKAKKAKKGKKEPVKKGKAPAKKVVEPTPAPVIEPEEEVVIPSVEKEKSVEPEKAEVEEVVREPTKSLTPPPAPPAKSISPVRPPLRATSSNVSTPSASSFTHRPSPGPITKEGTPSAPGGIRWKAPRNDLTSVLAKFGGAKRSGLTKKLKIVPLHSKIGTPVKALPPVPKKPEKKKVDEDEDEDEEDGDGSEDENGNGNKQLKKAKKTLEWLMMED